MSNTESREYELRHQLFDNALETLRLGVRQLAGQGNEGSHIVSLVFETLKLDLNLDTVEQIRANLREHLQEGGVTFRR